MDGGASRLETSVPGYRIDAVLGHGGMGTVYRARQLRLGRDVALKIMAPDLAADPTFRERFVRESQLAASIEHPNIVPVFDAGEVDLILYIAMRYIAGSDLRTLIARDGRLAPGLAVAVLAQVAGALDAAHARGLVHRDVKPSNVLIAAGGPEDSVQAFLTDFGISKRVVETTGGGLGRPLGSVQYMSPEQIRGETVDARSDVYALGCLLYECLTGEAPFARDSDVAVMYAHLEASCPAISERAPEVGNALDEVVARALAKTPADRPASAGELAAAAAHALKGERADRRPSRPAVGDFPSGADELPRSPRMVGRLAEEAEMLLKLDDAIGGNGNVVLLCGESGIGKTTLARWVSKEAKRRGVATVWGVGGAFGETPPPYWHWIQIVRSLAQRPDATELFDRLGHARAWLAAIAPDIASMLPGIDSSPTRIDEGRFQIYDAITNLLTHAARASTVLVVLDDLQLADQASLHMLGFLGARVHESRLLVVGTYREEELGRGRNGAAAELAEILRLGTRVALTHLEAPQIDQLIAARTGGHSPELLTERVHEVTAGNPLFVSELLNLLEAEGKLTAPELATSGDLPLPSGISEAIAQRLAPLSQKGRDALSVAAVIGPSFRASTVALAAGLDPAELLRLLDDALELRLVHQVSDFADGYAFSHGLIQGSLYESLPRARRCLLHAAVGEALAESRDVAAGEGLAEIAYHFLEAAPAGGEERAVEYAARAAEQAVATFAYDQAVTLYSRALQIVGPAAAQRLALLQALGEAEMRAGDSEAARATLMQAADAARAHDDPAALARAALACNIWALSLGVDEPLVQLAEEAVERLEGSRETGLLACVKGLLAVTLYWSDQVERRERLAAEALALARSDHEHEPSSETEQVLAYVLARYLLTVWGPSSATEHLPLSDELLTLTHRLHNVELEILARNWRVTVLLELGRFSSVDQEIARLQQIATELRQPRAMVFLPLHHGSRAGTAGRFVEAERLNAESIEIGRRVRGTVGELAATAQLLSIRLQQGRLGELEGAVRALVNANPGMKGLHAVLLLILVQSGREREAAVELERLTASGSAGLAQDNVYIITLAILAEVAAELGDRTRANELYASLEPYAGRWVVSAGAAALWPVDRSLARLATAAGATELARGHIDRASAQAAGTAAAPSLALLALDEARLLLAEGRPEDRSRIARLAREARELAQELGMGLVVDAATLVEADVAE